MTPKSHTDRRRALLGFGLVCLFFYVPGNVGLSTDLVDGLRGLSAAGDLAACGCDGSDCCCGAPCCTPEVASCCGDAEPSCCGEPVVVDDPVVADDRIAFTVVCTCGLDRSRTQALIFSCDLHVLAGARPALHPAPPGVARTVESIAVPAPALDPPEQIPKRRRIG